jgi:hypothetical protein
MDRTGNCSLLYASLRLKITYCLNLRFFTFIKINIGYGTLMRSWYKCRSAVILESLDFFLPLPRNAHNNVKFACTRVIRLFTEVVDLFINIHKIHTRDINHVHYRFPRQRLWTFSNSSFWISILKGLITYLHVFGPGAN